MAIKDISVTPLGVQIIWDTPAMEVPKMLLPGSLMWRVYVDFAEHIFANVQEIKGLELTRIDVGCFETQFTWEKIVHGSR